MGSPECFDCEFGEGGYPCRRADGSFDVARAAQLYVSDPPRITEDSALDLSAFLHERLAESDDSEEGLRDVMGQFLERMAGEVSEDARESAAPIGACIFDLVQEHPELLPPLLPHVLDAVSTAGEASRVAAGVVEGALVRYGPALIAQVEALAKGSAKARYILSGVWGRSNIEPEVWGRVARAIGDAGRMDSDARTPRGEALGPEALGPVLAGEELARVLREPVCGARPDVPCFGREEDGQHYEVRPGAYAIWRDDASRVACMRTPTGLFLPGGGVDPGERVEAALVREVAEECGFACEVGRYLGAADEFVFSPTYERYFLKRGSFFEIKILGPATAVEDDHDLCWVQAEEAVDALTLESQRFAVLELGR